jgi:ABC-type multidrug transport system ATPase subunit
VIEARHISKAYGARSALVDASIAAAAGEQVVLTGDNGTGKTTLLHVIVGLRRSDEGQVLWKGRSLTGAGPRAWRRARASWGFLPQQLTLPPEASVAQLLRFCADVRGTGPGPARHWLGRVGLEDAEAERVESLSGGMRQRLGIALTLFFEPELVIMDEPASSLDPGWRNTLAQWVREAARRGAAVLVTSQLEVDWGPEARYVHCAAGHITDAAPPPNEP